MMNKQPWIGKPLTDIIFILSPPFFCLLLIALFPSIFTNESEISLLAWILLILFIDVAHVYSTLFRTYFDPGSFRSQRSLLLTIPFAGFIVGVLLYSIHPLAFWRVLAYLAVFHFIRQQYGFMRVYSRQEKINPWFKRIDTLAVYAATLYPILYWHISGPRNFNWFLQGDFYYLQIPGLSTVALIIYILILITYIVKEIVFYAKFQFVNLPRLMIVVGTFLSWYIGIVYFNGDLVFTLLNVVSHGIPYMALVWIYGRKNYGIKQQGGKFLKLLFSSAGFAIFISLLLALAFAEEMLWDLGVWQERPDLFGLDYSGIKISDRALNFIVPLLALPQITHYVLDGFIWKIKKDEFAWRKQKSETE